MRKLNYLFLMLLCSVTLFTSCSKDELDSIEVPKDNSRIIFSSTEELYATFNKVALMEYVEQISWINSSGIKNPLYYNLEYCSDEMMLDMPRAFQALFNKDMEVQIKDTVVVFNEGELLVKSINGEEPSRPMQVGTAKIENLEDPTTRSIYQIPYGKSYTHRYKFYIPGNKTHFRYDHEIKSVIINGNTSNLFLLVSFDYYKGNNRWRPASEPRSVQIDLNVHKRDFWGIDYNYEALINTQKVISGQKHTLEITGIIRQGVINHPMTTKTNYLNGLPYPEWN